MKFNKRTTLKVIKQLVKEDFGVELNNWEARDLRDQLALGYALWRSEPEYDDPYSREPAPNAEEYEARIITTGGYIRMITRRGVTTRAAAFYTTDEWNSTPLISVHRAAEEAA